MPHAGSTNGVFITEAQRGIHLWQDGLGKKKDWIQLWRVDPPRKTDVIPLLLKMIHLTSLQMMKDGGIPLKKGKRR